MPRFAARSFLSFSRPFILICRFRGCFTSSHFDAKQKKVLYKGYFYPLVKAALGNDTAQTKTDSITFGTNSTTFTVFACETGDWRFTEEFPKEADAIAWIKKKLKGEEQTTPPETGGEDSGGDAGTE